MSVTQLKQRVANNLYHRTMTMLYGIKNCAADYSDEQFQDDLLQIDLLTSRRDCSTLRIPPVKPLGHHHEPPIILEYGTCVPLPINSCCNK